MSDVSVGLDRRRLFVIGNLAIFMIGLGFAVRASIAADIQVQLFDPLDITRSASMVGEVVGATFTGFALTLLLGSAILDLVGMKRMLAFASFGFVAGSVVVLLASLMEAAAADVLDGSDRVSADRFRLGRRGGGYQPDDSGAVSRRENSPAQHPACVVARRHRRRWVGGVSDGGTEHSLAGEPGVAGRAFAGSRVVGSNVVVSGDRTSRSRYQPQTKKTCIWKFCALPVSGCGLVA